MKKEKPKARMINPFGATADYIRGKDAFGTGVSLNFKGEDTFNTIPGGLMSVIMMLFVYSYCIMKFKEMILVETWSLTQQTILNDKSEIVANYTTKDMANLTLAI